MIIDIEGTDGCGKHTQTEKLYDYLISRGFKCAILSFPNYDSKSSEPAKMYLNGEITSTADELDAYQTSSLFAVDRLITMKSLDLSLYDYILLDRYVPSNMIHQSTKIFDKIALDEFLNWIDDYEYNKLKLPRPDKIIFLDMPIEISQKLASERASLKSGTQRDIHEQDYSHLNRAYERAKYVAQKYNWLKIDCFDKKLKSIDEIHNEIKTILNN